MIDSFVQQVDVTCYRCGHGFIAELPLIVHAVQQPAPMQRIREGNLHCFTCPECRVETFLDAPAVLYRRGEEPALIFIPAKTTTPQEDEVHCRTLLMRLRAILGEEWQDQWLDPLTTVSQEMARFTFSEEAEGFHVLEVQQLANATLAFVSARSWREARDVLESSPSLLTPLADRMLSQVAADQPTPATRKQAEDGLAVLRRIREVGVDAAFAERLDSGLSKAFAVPDDLIEALRLFTAPPTWAQSREVLEARRELLLGDGVEDAFAISRDRFQTHPQMLKFLDEHRDILARARSEGIDQAFLSCPELKTAPMVDEEMWRELGLVSPQQRRDEFADAYVPREISQRELRIFADMVKRDATGALARAWRSLEELKALRASDLHRIKVLRGVLPLIPRTVLPAMWAAFTANLAASLVLTEAGSVPDNLEEALRCCTDVADSGTRNNVPGIWALAQSVMGECLRQRTLGDRGANVEEAIACYRRALSVWDRQRHAKQWAGDQHNLGAAHVERVHGDPADNVEKAIACYLAALEVRTKERFRVDWATTQNNLGNAYQGRVQHGLTQNIEAAIECYRSALEVFTLQEDSHEWANVQNNLGTAYRERRRGRRLDNLEQAITCHRRALEVWRKDTTPRRWGMAQVNLANDHATLYDDESAREAIVHYELALSYYREDEFPQEWAAIQLNLGNVFRKVGGEDRRTHIDAGVEHVLQALKVYRFENSPHRWAGAHFNLASLHGELAQEDPAHRLAAVDHCREALKVMSLEVDPSMHQLASRLLGNLHFDAQEWEAAFNAYEDAIAAARLLYEASSTPEARQIEMAETGNAPVSAAYALARLGRLAQAVETLERGLARSLNEVLALDRAALDGAPATDLAAMANARARIAALEAEARAPGGLGRRDFLSISNELRDARAALSGVVDRMQERQPDATCGEVKYRGIAATVAAVRQPMVYLAVSGRGSLALIVLPDQADPLVVWQDHFTAEHLSDLLLGSDPDDKEGYLLAAWSDDITGFRSMLDEVLRVAQDLWRPIGERLRDMGHRQAILIPVGLLAQLPMQAGAPSELVVSCAPSAQAVQACEMAASKRARGMPAFVGVGNPMPHPQPLLFAREEVREIAHYFDEGRQVLLCEEQATQERLFSALPGASHLHFACHGHFHPSRPLDSTLFLAEGGQLSLRDVLDGRLALSTLKLAVLSACQTGVTDFLGAPYEAFGFTTAFLRAGVPGVVSALWPVNDLSTALLFGEFYRHHVGDGVAPAAALGRAQRWLRDGSARELALADRYEQLYLDSGELDEDALHAMHHFRRHPDVRPFEHPYFWAAFVFTGLAAPSR